MAMDRTFSNAPDTEVRPEVRMLYYCLRLDNSGLSLKQVDKFIGGESVPITIGDAATLFGYHNVMTKHILGDSGYNICAELIRAMVLCTNGTMGLTGDVLNITDEFTHELNLAIKTDTPLRKAASIYNIITKYEAVKEHSKAFGYLMMVYFLQRDGFGLFVPDDDFISELLENNSMCADDIIRQLKMYLTVDLDDDWYNAFD